MADQQVTAEEVLLDVKVADASTLFKFYLNQEKKILGSVAVILFLSLWEFMGGALSVYNPIPVLRVNAMNATPRVALLPLIIIWLGIGILSKVGIIFLGAVFPMLINARDGVKTTPQNLLNAARSFGASEWQIFKSVVFPSTVPFILTGLRLGVGRALVGVLVGELYAATAGIGFMITVAGATFQTDKVFVGILVFAITGVILTAVLDRSERRFDKWRPKVGSAT